METKRSFDIHMTPTESRAAPWQFTWPKRLFLAVVFPAILLAFLEIVCGAFETSKWIPSSSTPKLLEMPTWMAREENTKMRAALKSVAPEDLEWLTLFEAGDTFRVRLIPGISRAVMNTFSQINADKHRRYFIQANSLGFRGPEISKLKPQGTLRVLVFGDSSSFGWGVNQDETYSAQLAQLLRSLKKFTRIEVGNFAMPGDSSEYGRLIFGRFAADFKPDLIILGFGANDAKRVWKGHKEQVEAFANSYHPLMQVLAGNSELIRTIRKLVALIQPQSLQPQHHTLRPRQIPAVSKRRYSENLAYMGDQALQMGAKQVLILTLCTPGDYAKVAKRVCAKNNFIFLNGQAYLKKLLPKIQAGAIEPNLIKSMLESYSDDLKREALYYITSDGCHPNALGHKLVAQKLAALIAETL